MRSILSLTQTTFGMAGFLSGFEGGLTPEATLSQKTQFEVIGAILGGGIEAAVSGAMASVRPNLQQFNGIVKAVGTTEMKFGAGAMSAVESVLADAAAAFVGYQLGEAMGIDPWEGAMMGFMLLETGRMGTPHSGSPARSVSIGEYEVSDDPAAPGTRCPSQGSKT